MDPTNPFRTLAPSVEGDVLAALSRTHAPLTGARIAELCERSGTRVRAILRNLEHHGIVHSERHGRAYSYTLNRHHVLADAIEFIFTAGERFEQRVTDAIAAWDVQPVAAALFGSFARRDGDADSDVDLLLVRPTKVSEDNDIWGKQRHHLAASIETWAGNPAQIVELAEGELADAIRRRDPLVANLQRDAVAVFGDIPTRLRVVGRTPQ